jgi:hypothetical protein
VQLGSTQTISMAQNVYIGLAGSANNNSVLAESAANFSPASFALLP